MNCLKFLSCKVYVPVCAPQQLPVVPVALEPVAPESVLEPVNIKEISIVLRDISSLATAVSAEPAVAEAVGLVDKLEDDMMSCVSDDDMPNLVDFHGHIIKMT